MINELWMAPSRAHRSGEKALCGYRDVVSLRLITYAATILMCNAVLGQTPAQEKAKQDSNLSGRLTSLPGINSTQTDLGALIEVACPNTTKTLSSRPANDPDFQTRCNRVLRAAPANRGAAVNALQQVSPEQIISQGTEATKISANVLGARLADLRGGAGGLSLAGFKLNGQSGLGNGLAGFSAYPETGGAAGDEGSPIWNRLGVFINGLGQFGKVDPTFNQVGFDFDRGGVTAGADYRFTKDLILGGAFTYIRTESSFDRNGGSLDSDSYTGSLYGNFYATEKFYLDGVATVGGIDYDSKRRISYTAGTGADLDVVNSQATAKPGGMQYSVSLGAGYNHSLGEVTLNPYARVNYTKLDLDGFSESGGSGWAMQFSDQGVESVTTTLGTQVSYSVSTPFGVLLPYVRGEWHHEYDDGSRNIPVRFLGDNRSGLTFITFTEGPDRNYFTVGTGISGTFAKGITAFLNYDALLGYRNIESHAFLVGARMEF